MSTETPLSQRRYRRRILGIGALLFVVAFVLGAVIFIPAVQNDLTDRLDDELAEAGIAGVSVSFSGQDGTLDCETPLEDPDAVRKMAEDLHGVRVIDFERSCTNTVVAESAPATTEAPEPDPTDPPATTEAPAPEPEPEPALDSIAEIAAGDALFGELSRLVASAGLDGAEGLGGDGPFTLLAPTDAAFDAAFDELGPDAFNRLTSDSDLLREVLLHHVADGEIRSGDFEAGTLTMLDGSDIEVDPAAADGITFTSDGSVAGVDDPATQLDIEGSNGVVHAIDMLLLPAGLDLSDPNAVTSGATFADGQITLTGVVQSEAQRAALVAAAQAQVDPANVIDELVLDADASVDQADIDSFASLIEAMPPSLVSGTATLTGSELTLTGVYLDDAANDAITAVGDSLGAELTLTPRPAADDDSAQALQDELNEFVRLNPVLFESNSFDLTPEAAVVIEQIAVRAQQLDGAQIQVVGFTDTDGDPGRNLTLSEGRAASVVTALVSEGLDAGSLSSEGRGIAEPILDADGVEDKPASRRVEFIVTAL